jgi:hypothetical protein
VRATLLLVALLASGCGLLSKPDSEQPEAAPVTMQLLAVLPVEPAAPPAGRSGGTTPLLPEEAGTAVTAQIYRVLADQTEFRFVADLAVSDVLTTRPCRAGNVVERAAALGKEVGADGVIFGRVFRFQKRVGTQFGASQPPRYGSSSGWFPLPAATSSGGGASIRPRRP